MSHTGVGLLFPCTCTAPPPHPPPPPPTGSKFRRHRTGAAVQAVEELNIKPRFWKDLLTDQPFSRKDLIHLQVRP